MDITYIITGASKGIGKYLFEQLCNVYGFYNTTKTDKICMYKVDIGNTDEIHDFIEINKSSLKNIVLINCAGINYNSMSHKANIIDWKKVIDVNLCGTFNVINAFLPLMREQKYGRIINMSSVVGKMGVMGTSAYAASKAGLTGMIKSIACENAMFGITINNLNLGYFNCGMIEQVPLDIQEKIKQTIPCKQFGNPENIYNAVEFLIKSDYVNGAGIDINGGLI